MPRSINYGVRSTVKGFSEIGMTTMLIGELAKQTGLSKDTIRFYEKMGLIAASHRPAGTRFYKEAQIWWSV